MKTHFDRIILGASLAIVCAVGTTRAEKTSAPPAAEQTSYVGTWKVRDGSNRVFFITIKPDGLAASRWEDPAESRRNQRGTWKRLDDGVVVLWENGWRETLTPGESGVVKRAYAPKLTIGGKPSNESPAEPVAPAP